MGVERSNHATNPPQLDLFLYNSSQVEGGGDGEDADELGKDWLPVILPAMLQHLEGS